MKRRDYTLYLRDIVTYVAKAQRFVAGFHYDEFTADEEKIFAVIYALGR